MRCADKKRNKIRKLLIPGILLLTGLLLAGCGKGQETESGNPGEETPARQAGTVEQESGQETLYAQYRSVSMDNVRLAVNEGGRQERWGS